MQNACAGIDRNCQNDCGWRMSNKQVALICLALSETAFSLSKNIWTFYRYFWDIKDILAKTNWSQGMLKNERESKEKLWHLDNIFFVKRIGYFHLRWMQTEIFIITARNFCMSCVEEETFQGIHTLYWITFVYFFCCGMKINSLEMCLGKINIPK